MNGLTRQDFTVISNVSIDTFESDICQLWNERARAHANLTQAKSGGITSLHETYVLNALYQAADAAYVRALFIKASISLTWIDSAKISIADSVGSRVEIRYFDTNPKSADHGHVTVFKNGKVVRHRTPRHLRKHLQLVK